MGLTVCEVLIILTGASLAADSGAEVGFFGTGCGSMGSVSGG